jgi:multicomponent Na+:H+ antiporter subunit E
MNRFLLGVWLTFVWVLLWGTPSPGNVLAGAVLAVLLVLVIPVGPDRGGGVRPLAVLHFGLYFAWALVVATATVAATILRPRLRLEQGIVAVPLRAVSPLVVAFVSNATTLTPGTLTVDIRPRHYGVTEEDPLGPGSPTEVTPVIYVHCLQTGDPDEIRAGIHRVEQLAVEAFGSAEDRRAILGPPPAWPRAVEPEKEGGQ